MDFFSAFNDELEKLAGLPKALRGLSVDAAKARGLPESVQAQIALHRRGKTLRKGTMESRSSWMAQKGHKKQLRQAGRVQGGKRRTRELAAYGALKRKKKPQVGISQAEQHAERSRVMRTSDISMLRFRRKTKQPAVDRGW